MKLSRNMKKVLAYVCALAMVVGLTTAYKASNVKANGTDTVDGIIYTVTDGPQGSWTGIVCQGILDHQRIHFAWGIAVKPESIKVSVNDQNIANVLGTSANGCHILLEDAANAVNKEEGTYDLVLTATAQENETELSWTAEFKLEKQGETESTAPINGPEDVAWDGIEWVGNGSGNSAVDNYCKLYVVDGMNTVNWQSYATGNEHIINHSKKHTDGYGLYMHGDGVVSGITVNGVSSNEYAAENNGAQLWLFPTAFTAQYNTVIIKTNANKEYTLYAYAPNFMGKNDEDPSEPTTPGGTTQPENELVPENLVEATKEAPARSDGVAYADEHKVPNISFTKDTWYKATVSVTSTVDREIQFRFQDANWDYRDITTGDYSNDELFKTNSTWSVNANETKEIVYIFQSKMTTIGGIFDICFGYVNKPVDAGSITFKNVSLTTYSSQEEAEEAAGYLDVSKYQEEVPTSEGELFAGWYSDPGYTTPYTDNSGKAYAKFVNEKILEVGAQAGKDGKKIRFISTIDDCLDYNEIGFEISGKHGETVLKQKTCKSGTVLYTSVKENSDSKTAPEVFGAEEAAYIFTFAVTGLSSDSEWTVTPYYITADGSKVTGTTKQFKQTAEGVCTTVGA